MTDKTDSEIIFAHIETNPEAFLEALQTRSSETQKAVLEHLKTLPENEATNDKPAVTLDK